MSRSLVAPLLRLVRAVRAARSGGPSALERLAARAPAGPSRRQFVGGAAALAACRPEPERRDPASPRVVILGAGLAGLTCCHRLAQGGVYAEVWEARDRVGGRVVTGRDLFPALPGLTSELGAEWVNSGDAELLALAGELGLSLHDSYEEFDLADLYWFDGRRVLTRALTDDLERLTVACDEALAAFPNSGADLSYREPGGAEALDQTTAAAWLAGLGLGRDAQRLAETLILADYGRELDDQSALNVVSFFTSAGGDLYDERYLIAGGNDQVPTGLAARYTDRITLGRALLAATQRADGSWRLSAADGTEVLADVVVNTLPFTVLRELDLVADVPEVKRRCIDELGYGTNAKLMLPFSRRFWRDAGDNGFTVNDLFQEGWDGAMLQGLAGGAFATFRGGDAGLAVGTGAVEERGAELLAQLETLWPGCSEALVGEAVRAAWPDDPFALGSYSCYRPGQWTGIGGAESEPIGTMFFAGEHTSVVFQGYMNGAAETGAAAAADVLATRSSQARLPRRPRAGRRRGARG
jgi:monoamine oxidase